MNINLVVVKTNQPESLVAFYEQIGFQFNHLRHGNGPLHYAAQLPNFAFEIYPLPDRTNAPDNTTRLGFTVPDLDYVLEKLKQHGNPIKKEPTVTAWGYQGLAEDPDGRKIELTEENIHGKFLIEDKFKITGRGLVIAGTISEGQIATGNELIFIANGIARRRRIKGIDFIRKTQMSNQDKVGLLIHCINDEEVDELRNWNTEGEGGVLALVKNNLA